MTLSQGGGQDQEIIMLQNQITLMKSPTGLLVIILWLVTKM
uniref:Uncharacterized protein n=1 Tax=Arundo donax TaxID=35708 RepID=A0A0A9EJ04_ARUDO